MRQGVLISTTEHLLSTLYSFAVDNAYMEIDNLEVPILDGSGKPFVELMRAGRRAPLRRRRRYLRIRRPVTVEDGKKRISILPAKCFRLTCEMDFSPLRSEAVARNGSDAGTICGGDSPRPAPSDLSTNWSRCARWG